MTSVSGVQRQEDADADASLVVRDLSFSFSGTSVIHDFNLSLPRGSRCLLCGANGAGAAGGAGEVGATAAATVRI